LQETIYPELNKLIFSALSNHLEDLEILKSAVGIITNILESLMKSQIPDNQKILSTNLVEGK
jgi:hypothetical protein